MSDLISRKALIDALFEKEQEYEEVMTVPTYATAMQVIRSMPVVGNADEYERLKERDRAKAALTITAIRNCPFCGGEAINLKVDDIHSIMWTQCHTRSDVYLSLEEAIEAWNRRTEEIR